MQDVCWIHNQKYRIGDQCPDCLKREQSYKQSLYEEAAVEENAKKHEPGDRFWGVVKALVLVNLALWVVMILGAVLLSR